MKTSISRMTFWNMEVRCTIRWLGGGLAVIVGLLVGELVLGELVLVELVASRPLGRNSNHQTLIVIF